MSDRDGVPIGDVDVRVVWDTGGVERTVTDRSGTARLAYKDTGEAYFHVSKSGFLAQAGYYRPAGQELYFWLTPGVPIHGNVVDSVTGHPIASAVVRVDGYDASRHLSWDQSVTTDAAGVFEIAGVKAGVPFGCVVTCDGYAPVTFRRTASGAGDEFTVKLGGAHTLGGVVVDAGGNPVRAARVFARDLDWPMRVQRADFDRMTPRCSTDRHGRFDLRGIRNLPVRLVAVGEAGLFGVSKLLQGAAEDRTEDATIVIRRRSLLRISLFDSLPSPIEDAYLSLEGYGGLLREPGSPGVYSYGPLGQGAYLIRVALPGRVVRTIPVQVAVVGVNEISITLDGGRAVEGIVVNTRGEPVVGLQVSYRWHDNGEREEWTEAIVTDADGRFELHGLTSRDGELVVEDPGFGYMKEVEEVAPGGPAVKVVVRESPRLLVRLGSGARNRPVHVAYGMVGEIFGRTVSADGAGDLRFSGLPSRRPLWLTVQVGTAAPYIWPRLTLEPGTTRDLGAVSSRRRVSIRGTVVDAFGDALGDVRVWASAENPDWAGTVAARSDQAGKFSIVGLPPVAHVLTATRAGYRTVSETVPFPMDEDQPVVLRLPAVDGTAK